MFSHDILMVLTTGLPCKTIEINNKPYLERYHIKTNANGTQHWLHRFLRSDSERHLHSHPWTACSTIMCGCYKEEYRYANWSYDPHLKKLESFNKGDVNFITPDKLHRIIEVDANTWTYMIVQPEREPFWYFINDNGITHEMKTSEPNWWQEYGVRK